MSGPHTIHHLVYPGFQSLDLVGPYEVFAGANLVLEQPAYDQTVVSLDGGLVRSESGLEFPTEGLTDVGPDSLAIAGGIGVFEACGNPRLEEKLRATAAAAGRLLTICTGSFLAAQAGLLGGHRVATHWARSKQLREWYPELDVDPDPLFIQSGTVWTSAGVTAGMDMALAVVEQDHDSATAQIVARWLVLHLRRPGGQSQFAAPIWFDPSPLEPVRTAQQLIASNPAGDHAVESLGRAVGISARHLTRLFSQELGITPARFVEQARVEVARVDLEQTSLTVAEVARRAGFGSGESLRRAFHRRLGLSPDDYRRRFSLSPSTT